MVTSAEIQRGVAETLAAHHPDTWRYLLAHHVPDETGHCVACRRSSRGRPLSPCNLWVVAEMAQWISSGARARPLG